MLKFFLSLSLFLSLFLTLKLSPWPLVSFSPWPSVSFSPWPSFFSFPNIEIVSLFGHHFFSFLSIVTHHEGRLVLSPLPNLLLSLSLVLNLSFSSSILQCIRGACAFSPLLKFSFFLPGHHSLSLSPLLKLSLSLTITLFLFPWPSFFFSPLARALSLILFFVQAF